MRITDITKPELAVMLKLHQSIGAQLEHISSDMSCAACKYFAPSTNHCIKWRAPVPVENQPAGCDEWSWDDIPF